MTDPFGQAPPTLRTEIPGPASRALAARLARVESRNITRLQPVPPIIWAEASGANVRDVDGNVFIDLTAGFGVAAAGHSNPEVVQAIARQAGVLAHGLGDVHPTASRVALLEKLAAIAPAPLSVAILGSAGAEAVEAALKTALLKTGRPGIVAFEGSYHGLTYGALALTHRAEFRDPFLAQLNPHVRFAPFPESAADLEAALEQLDRRLDDTVGAIIVEPIQGRGGLRFPASGFLEALRARCDGERRLLIFDEIYTGLGRTGRWFACQHADSTPDLLLIGKALTGSIALSAALASREVMDAWPPSHGEAIHTSTFLGNPVACAAALAQLRQIEERGLLARAAAIGQRIAARTRTWPARLPVVRQVRGIGALQAVELQPKKDIGVSVCDAALARGVIILAEGAAADVLAICPPLVIADAQIEHALDVLEAALTEAGHVLQGP